MLNINTGQNPAILAEEKIARLLATGNKARDGGNPVWSITFNAGPAHALFRYKDEAMASDYFNDWNGTCLEDKTTRNPADIPPEGIHFSDTSQRNDWEIND